MVVVFGVSSLLVCLLGDLLIAACDCGFSFAGCLLLDCLLDCLVCCWCCCGLFADWLVYMVGDFGVNVGGF